MRLDTEAGARLAHRAAAAVPDRAGPGHHAVQLPAEPGGAQGRARARRSGAPIVVKPASATPIGSLRLAEFFAETDLPKGMYQVLPVSSKVADGDGARRPVPQDLVHRVGRDRLVPQGPRPEEAGDAGARRQRRRDRAQRRRPRLRRAADRVRRLLPGRTELHQRAARARRLRGLRRLRGPARRSRSSS